MIKSPKEDRVGKDMCLEIFGNNTFLCPVRALNKYLSERTKVDRSSQDLPFFLKRNSNCLSDKDFNIILSELTADVTENSSSIVRSHSLRACVPSELAKKGVDPHHIQGVGRWSSDAWKDYCKLGRKKRMNITDNLCSSII